VRLATNATAGDGVRQICAWRDMYVIIQAYQYQKNLALQDTTVKKELALMIPKV
jgi:hypothetical protein